MLTAPGLTYAPRGRMVWSGHKSGTSAYEPTLIASIVSPFLPGLARIPRSVSTFDQAMLSSNPAPAPLPANVCIASSGVSPASKAWWRASGGAPRASARSMNTIGQFFSSAFFRRSAGTPFAAPVDIDGFAAPVYDPGGNLFSVASYWVSDGYILG